MKVTVVGGGIIGCSIAFELLRGGDRVTIVEPNEPGSEASTAAGGMLAPQNEAHAPGPFLDLCVLSRAAWPAFARALEEASGVSAQYLPSGILYAAFDELALHQAAATAEWQRASGLRVELLDARQAREREPHLGPGVLGAAFFPDDAQVEPRAVIPSLVKACERHGVEWVRAAAASVEGQTVTLSDGRTLDADAVVIAAGAWASQLSNVTLPRISPVRGQMLEFAAGAVKLSQIVGGLSGYLIPRADGRIITGSTTEHVGFEKNATDEGKATILGRIEKLIPALARAPIARSWTGLRPWAHADLPVLGAGADPGVFLALGHFRNGILLAPLTARLLAQALHGKKTAVPLTPFRYDRLTA